MCALLLDMLMSGFMFTTDDKPGCRCTTCANTWAAELPYSFSEGVISPLVSMNYGAKMSISYNCMKQPSYAAPFGECRMDYHPMHSIQLGGGSVSDLKVGPPPRHSFLQWSNLFTFKFYW